MNKIRKIQCERCYHIILLAVLFHFLPHFILRFPPGTFYIPLLAYPGRYIICSCNSLPQKHALSADGLCTAGFSCFPEEFCFFRIVYNIAYYQIRTEYGFVRNQGNIFMRFHPCHCSVYQNICFCDLFFQFVLIFDTEYLEHRNPVLLFSALQLYFLRDPGKDRSG